MGFEAYRVRKTFGWNGWQFSPGPRKECNCRRGIEMCHANNDECGGAPGMSCAACTNTACKCSCMIKKEVYAGDIWIVQEGHPRKEIMLEHHHAVYDSGLPAIEEIMKHKRYRRLKKSPKEAVAA